MKSERASMESFLKVRLENTLKTLELCDYNHSSIPKIKLGRLMELADIVYTFTGIQADISRYL